MRPIVRMGAHTVETSTVNGSLTKSNELLTSRCGGLNPAGRSWGHDAGCHNKSRVVRHAGLKGNAFGVLAG